MSILNTLAVAAGGLLLMAFKTAGDGPLQSNPGQEESETRKSERVFIGYVYQQPKKINFGLYTHLCHAFVVADGDGKIRPSKTCPIQQLVTDYLEHEKARRS